MTFIRLHNHLIQYLYFLCIKSKQLSVFFYVKSTKRPNYFKYDSLYISAIVTDFKKWSQLKNYVRYNTLHIIPVLKTYYK